MDGECVVVLCESVQDGLEGVTDGVQGEPLGQDHEAAEEQGCVGDVLGVGLRADDDWLSLLVSVGMQDAEAEIVYCLESWRLVFSVVVCGCLGYN